MNMSRLRSLRSAVGGAVAGVIGHHYGGKLLSYKEDKNEELMQTERDQALMSMREKMENVERQLVEVNERISRQNTLLDNKVESEIAEFKDDVVEVSNIVGTGTTNIEEGRKSLDMSFSNNLDDANFKKGIEYLNEGKENLVNASNKLSELLEKLNGKNQFIGESEITSLYKYLDSLNILEESAIFHIVIILTIICIVWNIYSVIFANEIIKYFNLENKYPRLNKFFILRRQFQWYYLVLNLVFFIIICIFVLCLDILVLI